MTRLRNDALVHSLEEDLILRNEVRATSNIITTFMLLPGLRGLWSMAPFDSNGGPFDQSGNARTLTNADPTTLRFYYDRLMPVTNNPLLSVGYFHRADEAGLDIIGTETYVAAAIRGLTWGGWFRAEADITSDKALMTKWNTTGNQRAYRLYLSNGNAINCEVSSNGTLVTTVTSATTLVAGKWYFIVGRYDPSTELSIFVQNTETSNTVAIPASIFNSSARLEILAENVGSDIFERGRNGLCFLCATFLSDAILTRLYEKSKILIEAGALG